MERRAGLGSGGAGRRAAGDREAQRWRALSSRTTCTSSWPAAPSLCRTVSPLTLADSYLLAIGDRTP